MSTDLNDSTRSAYSTGVRDGRYSDWAKNAELYLSENVRRLSVLYDAVRDRLSMTERNELWSIVGNLSNLSVDRWASSSVPERSLKPAEIGEMEIGFTKWRRMPDIGHEPYGAFVSGYMLGRMSELPQPVATPFRELIEHIAKAGHIYEYEPIFERAQAALAAGDPGK